MTDSVEHDNLRVPPSWSAKGAEFLATHPLLHDACIDPNHDPRHKRRVEAQ